MDTRPRLLLINLPNLIFDLRNIFIFLFLFIFINSFSFYLLILNHFYLFIFYSSLPSFFISCLLLQHLLSSTQESNSAFSNCHLFRDIVLSWYKYTIHISATFNNFVIVIDCWLLYHFSPDIASLIMGGQVRADCVSFQLFVQLCFLLRCKHHARTEYFK